MNRANMQSSQIEAFLEESEKEEEMGYAKTWAKVFLQPLQKPKRSYVQNDEIHDNVVCGEVEKKKVQLPLNHFFQESEDE